MDSSIERGGIDQHEMNQLTRPSAFQSDGARPCPESRAWVGMLGWLEHGPRTRAEHDDGGVTIARVGTERRSSRWLPRRSLMMKLDCSLVRDARPVPASRLSRRR